MAEIKKETNTDNFKQLNTFKATKLNELTDEILKEKTRAAVILASFRAKKEVLSNTDEVVVGNSEDIKEEPKITVSEQTEIIVDMQNRTKELEISETVVAENAKAEAVVETKQPVSDKTEMQKESIEMPVEKEIPAVKANQKNDAVGVPSVDNAQKLKPSKKETMENKHSGENAPRQKTDKKPKTEKPVIRQTSSNPNIAQTEEVLPSGELRRIYIPPTPQKPKVQTRVFTQNGNGGYNSRPPRQQNQQNPNGSFQNRNQNAAGRPMRPNGGTTNIASLAKVAAQFPPTKAANQKGKNVKNNTGNNSQKFDDHTLNKRALLKKGYIVDDKSNKIGYDDEDVKIRNIKSKNKAINNTSFIVIENAVITTDPVPIKILSEKIGKTGAEIIKTLFFLGIVKTINETIDFDTAELVAGEYNITLEYKPAETLEEALASKNKIEEDEDKTKLKPRPPIVTIMGHVDHGKTSLLDYIRNAHVTSGEAGGITQHIGAYTVSLNGEPITFLDTPGHEAFTSMRARGAQVTDIAVLVVAADDGIMPQTIEAINHSKQANVPIIVAVNKMDKNTANPERILQQLTEHGILPEDWGGETPVVKVSAKTGQGVDDLLANILTLAEIKELKANPNRDAKGSIIEAKIDKGLGKIATILVQNGTLHIGDNVVAGCCTGKIRLMLDDKGKAVKKAGPSKPVSVTGWDELPEAGDSLSVVKDEKFARDLVMERKLKLSNTTQDDSSVSLNDLFDKIQKGELKSVKLIIKADVQGSLEAVKQSLSKLGNEEVNIEIIHGAVGGIKESDVTLAETAKAIIIGFNVRPDQKARTLAAQKKIDVRLYDIIYDAIEDIEKAVHGLLAPKYEEEILGSAEVRELFKISGVGVIAGSHVTEGKVIRGAKARIIRDGKVEYTGEIVSLRHNKDDVKEMQKNYDCGITLLNFQDIKQGDIIEAFQMVTINE